MPERITDLWADAPLGMAVYEPTFAEDGTLSEMTLVWFNEAMERLTKLSFHHTVGKTLREIAPTSWNENRARFSVLLATGRAFSYYRHYEAPDSDIVLDFYATCWTSQGLIALVIRDTSLDPVDLSDATDVNAALRLLNDRTRRTEALAAMLVTHKQYTDLESI